MVASLPATPRYINFSASAALPRGSVPACALTILRGLSGHFIQVVASSALNQSVPPVDIIHTMANSQVLPDFDNLPPVEGMPKGCAWGLFDKDGKKDLLGTLNLLTPEVVKNAAAEVKDGVSISLEYVHRCKTEKKKK